MADQRGIKQDNTLNPPDQWITLIERQEQQDAPLDEAQLPQQTPIFVPTRTDDTLQTSQDGEQTNNLKPLEMPPTSTITEQPLGARKRDILTQRTVRSQTTQPTLQQSLQLTTTQRIQLEQLKEKISIFQEILDELQEYRTEANRFTQRDLDGQETTLNQEWAEFYALHDRVIDFIPLDDEYLTQRMFSQASSLKRQCLKLIYNLSGMLTRNEVVHQPTAQTQPTPLKAIGLPTFDGKFSEWKQFSNMFRSLVGNSTSMPPVQKLARLREALRGPAAALIAAFDTTDENYDLAWQTLVNKYENPRLIAQALFNRVMGMKRILKATPEALSTNSAIISEVRTLIETTGIPIEKRFDQLLIHMLRLTLDADTLRAWTMRVGESKEFPDPEEFIAFVDTCAKGMIEETELKANLKDTRNRQPQPTRPKSKVHTVATQQGQETTRGDASPSNCCAYCKGTHFIAHCKEFTALAPKPRYDFIDSKRLCFNCLGPHLIHKCKSKGRKFCFKCKGEHHTLIHAGSPYMTGTPQQTSQPLIQPPKPQTEATPPSSDDSNLTQRSAKAVILKLHMTNEDSKKEPQEISNSTRLAVDSSGLTNGMTLAHDASASGGLRVLNGRPEEDQQQTSKEILEKNSNHSTADNQLVLLATAQALALSPRGFSIKARILIDQGSELSFIADHLVHQLHLQRRSSTIDLIGIGGLNSGHTRGVVSIILQSIDGTQSVQLNTHILKKLTARLPSFSCSSASIGSLENLNLADPNYLKPGSIDLIIGADNYGRIIEDKIVRSRNTQLVGQRTIFGWILSGPICYASCSPSTSLTAVKKSANEQLLELLQKFWNQEEPPLHSTTTSELSPEELECEEHFQRTHTRDEHGRYIVRLPLRISPYALGDSKLKATRQLQAVKRRLHSNEALTQLYMDFMKEYETLGHMVKAPDSPEPSPAYYLPHHGVLREEAITTKLRVVFNGSSLSSTGVSMNDILHSGEKLQVDAMDVLTWMRKFKYVLSTDIVKMFRQIRVHQDDWDLQRIVWFNEDNQVTPYQLTTVTYGLNCSPWLSLRVLQQLAKDEGHRFPAAVQSILKGRYVDDIYAGAESEEDLKEIATQLTGLCHAGGFPLQKWNSNCPQALQKLGFSTAASTVHFEESVIKVLGLCWQPSTDTFGYKSKQFDSTTFTKRTLLSEIAQIFDPLGFIAPVIVRGKILIQDLWRLKLNWDEAIPLEYKRQWVDFRENLHQLHQVSIPRWLNLSSKRTTVQIHGFADASTSAMGAVVYLRTQSINETPSVVMVCAKTKVAPIKRMTIPRLELAAALLLTQLVVWTQERLEMDNIDIYLWSDSTIALAWINSHASRWRDFVHNRVTKIQESLPGATWRHVGGTENPADCASRGTSPQQLAENQLWWTGPDWLTQRSQFWPQSPLEYPEEASTEEKPAPAHPVAIRANAMATILERYSNMEKVLQVTATLNRAIDRFRRQPPPPARVLTPEELNGARLFWIKITQLQYFSSVLQILNAGNQLPKRHPLAKLTPILDDQETLRLGGRLKNSLLNADEIHPIILPRQSRLTTLIIEEAHRKTLHGGTQLTLAHTRQKYWIIGGRGTVRAFILRCVICTRHRGQRAQQLMGQLPSTRVTPARAFIHTGIDYAGPFPILKWRPTNAQPASVHIAIFVCLTTSAVHLELVSRQSSAAFIATYKRFTGRRGVPEILYSDNAPYFEGAAEELKRLYQQESEENQEIQASLAMIGTKWSFIPPRAPNFGGKWEAAVKSVKHHLKRVLGPSTFTYEELNTVLIQIEACLNSRPIAPMSDDPDDLQALTPGHFLIGEPLKVIPEPSISNENPNKVQRWNLVTQKTQQLWSRWSRECLQRYQAIYKWKHRQENLKAGDMVLMINEDYPPAKWPIARVSKVYTGADGLVRVADIKTAHAEVPTQPDGTPIPETSRVTYSTYTRPISKLCLLLSDPLPTEQPQEILDPIHSEDE